MSEIENLEREIAEKQARLAELRAKEPDWGPAVDAFLDATLWVAGRERIERGLKAAFAAIPLAPVVGMSEEEIEGLATKCMNMREAERGPRHLARLCIRETLRRAPKAWPSEEVECLIGDLAKTPWGGEVWERSKDLNAFAERARRLKAWQTGESGNPAVRIQPAKPPVLATAEPEWIDWHGGECPVPAGTRVEVRFRDETKSADLAEYWFWPHENCRADITAYRILPGERA